MCRVRWIDASRNSLPLLRRREDVGHDLLAGNTQADPLAAKRLGTDAARSANVGARGLEPGYESGYRVRWRGLKG